MKQTEVVNHWIDVAKKMLLHKKIVGVRYLLDEEMEMLYLYAYDGKHVDF